MKYINCLVEGLLIIIMIISFIFFISRLNYPYAGDKQIVYIMFLLLVFLYILISLVLLVLFYKTSKRIYRNIFLLMSMFYLLGLLYILIKN
jgi:hypothetical protein